VIVAGSNLPALASIPDAAIIGWYYEAATQTLHIQTPKLNTQQQQLIEFR